MSQEELREAIESITKYQECGDDCEYDWEKITCDMRTLITTAEQVLAAGEELPQERCGDRFQCFEEEKFDAGFNEALSLCLPILAKKNLRIAELERALAIESQEPEERSQEANHYNWLDNENEKLQMRIRELEEKALNDKDEILATLSNLSSHGLDNTDCTEEEITYALNEVLKYFGEKLTWLEEDK